MSKNKLLWYVNFTVVMLTLLLNEESDVKILAGMLLPMLYLSWKQNFKEK